jgi:hypothetical protein
MMRRVLIGTIIGAAFGLVFRALEGDLNHPLSYVPQTAGGWAVYYVMQLLPFAFVGGAVAAFIRRKKAVRRLQSSQSESPVERPAGHHPVAVTGTGAPEQIEQIKPNPVAVTGIGAPEQIKQEEQARQPNEHLMLKTAFIAVVVALAISVVLLVFLYTKLPTPQASTPQASAPNPEPKIAETDKRWVRWPTDRTAVAGGFKDDDGGSLVIACETNSKLLLLTLVEPRASWQGATPMRFMTKIDDGTQLNETMGSVTSPMQLVVRTDVASHVAAMGRAAVSFTVGTSDYARSFPAANFRRSIEPVLAACGGHW